MQSKDTRVFTVDGKQVRFDAQIFNKNFESCRRSKKIGVGEFEEQLAEKTECFQGSRSQLAFPQERSQRCRNANQNCKNARLVRLDPADERN